MIDLDRALQAIRRALAYTYDSTNNRFWLEKVENHDGLWLVAIDSESASYREYSGQAVLVMVDGELSTVLHGPFAFSSHPGQIRTKAEGTPDVDKDGLQDVAWAVEGVAYPMTNRLNSADRFNPSTKYQPVFRDVAGHGRYVDVVSENIRMWPGTAIQYHAGSSSKPISVGCFTSPPRDYDIVKKKILATGVKEFRIVFEHTETYEVMRD